MVSYLLRALATFLVVIDCLAVILSATDVVKAHDERMTVWRRNFSWVPCEQKPLYEVQMRKCSPKCTRPWGERTTKSDKIQ